MATAITPIAASATPYSKKFLLQGDGAEGIFSLDDFQTYLDPGPLREALHRTPPLAVGALNIDGTRGGEIRIYMVGASVADAVAYAPASRRIYWKNDTTTALAGLSCTLPDPGETATDCVIEIRFNHSTQG